MAIVNRKRQNLSLSLTSSAKLDTLAARLGKPKARIFDKAVDILYEREEQNMEQTHHLVTLACATNKGGAGKTTTSAAFADILAKRGSRVLVIDTDPQGNLSSRFGYDPTNLYEDYLGKLLRDRLDIIIENGVPVHQPIERFIHESKGYPRVDIIFSDIRLDNDYKILSGSTNGMGAFVFKTIVEEIRKLDRYDYVVFDTRPSLNNEVGSVFIATDYVIIPVPLAKDAVYGADATMRFIIGCKAANERLHLLGIFLTKVSQRTKTAHEVAPFVKQNWAKYLFKTEIPRSQDAVNAENKSEPVTSVFANKKLAKRYELLVDEALERIASGGVEDGDI